MDINIFRPKVEAILRKSDLETVSAKSVRQQLQKELGLDFKAQKALLNGLIKECFENITQASSSIGNDTKSEPRDSILTPSPPLPRKKSKTHSDVKRERTVKESGEDADARYARELQAQYNSPRASRTAGNGATAKRKRPLMKKKKTETIIYSDGETVEVEVKKRKITNNGFNKLLTLSTELSELLGGTLYLSRPQVSKQVWAYIKAEGLQDQSDKRYIDCDAMLSNVLGVKRVHMFTMTKLLQRHMLDDGTAPQSEDQSALVDSDSDDEDQKPKAESGTVEY